MLITALEVGTRNKELVNVYIDGEFNCSLTALTVAQHRLKAGQQLTLKEWQDILLVSEVQIAFDKGLGYAAKYFKTEKQVYDYLGKKGFPPQVCEQAVQKLKYYKYIDDEQYAQSFVQSNSTSKGARRIERELISKGVDRELAKTSTQLDKEQSQETCNALTQKFVAGKTVNTQTLQRLQRFLLYRGFDYEQIAIALRLTNRGENDDRD